MSRFLLQTVIALVARLTPFSIHGIRLIVWLLLPAHLVTNVRRWPDISTYARLLRPGERPVTAFVKYCWAQDEKSAWTCLVHSSWDHAARHCDFSGVDDLKAMAERGRGLLLLSMHYGPMLYGYILARSGLDFVTLVYEENVPHVDGAFVRQLLTKKDIFLGTHQGLLIANKSERRFVRRMLAGIPGVLLADLFADGNHLAVPCLDIEYPIGVFPFKLALRHAFPIAVVWLSRIEGYGYRLNVRELAFRTVEEGVARYASLLEHAVRSDPYLWNCAFSKEWVERRRRSAPHSLPQSPARS